MRWYKCYTDNHRGRTVQKLFNEVGPGGVAAYYIILEMCAEKLNKMSNRNLTEEDCLFRFDIRLLLATVRLRLATVDHLLTTCSSTGVLKWTTNDNEIVIEMPILLDLLDSHSKKSVYKTDSIRKKSAPEKNRIEKNILKIYKKNSEEKEGENSSKSVAEQQGKHFVLTADMLEFVYSFFPRKVGKAKGFEILKKTIKTEEQFKNLIAAVHNYKEECASKKTEEKFIRMFSTFIGPADKPFWTDYIKVKKENAPPFNENNPKVFKP